MPDSSGSGHGSGGELEQLAGFGDADLDHVDVLGWCFVRAGGESSGVLPVRASRNCQRSTASQSPRPGKRLRLLCGRAWPSQSKAGGRSAPERPEPGPPVNGPGLRGP